MIVCLTNKTSEIRCLIRLEYKSRNGFDTRMSLRRSDLKLMCVSVCEVRLGDQEVQQRWELHWVVHYTGLFR